MKEKNHSLKNTPDWKTIKALAQSTQGENPEEKNQGYLDFSLSDFSDSLELEQTLAYFSKQGYLDNDLTKARLRHNRPPEKFEPNTLNCAFCHRPLKGKSFTQLSDGRKRCTSCSKTAIDHKEDFEEIVDEVLYNLQDFYGCSLKKQTVLRMTDSKKVSEALGVKYERGIRKIAGFARFRNRKNFVYVENGAPRLNTISTVVHELTHAWQFENWKDRSINQFIKARDKTLLPKMYLLLMEGMAVWSEIQYLYCIGEIEQAYYMDSKYSYKKNNDEYSLGYRLYKKRYPLALDGILSGSTPFSAFPPLDYEVLERASRTVEVKSNS